MPRSDGFKNLVPLSKRTPEERKAIQQKGADSSHARQKEKRTLKTLLELAMSERLVNKTTRENKSRKEVTAIVLADKCVRGDLKAIALMAQLIGESTQKVEVTGKDGRDLVPAHRLTREEAKELIQDLEKDY